MIDTLYFGSFVKANTCQFDEFADNCLFYIYCPGPRSMFTLLENSENAKSLPTKVSKSFVTIAIVLVCCRFWTTNLFRQVSVPSLKFVTARQS